jgi:hypothetical protein
MKILRTKTKELLVQHFLVLTSNVTFSQKDNSGDQCCCLFILREETIFFSSSIGDSSEACSRDDSRAYFATKCLWIFYRYIDCFVKWYEEARPLFTVALKEIAEWIRIHSTIFKQSLTSQGFN